MLNVPEAVKTLFQTDGILKNIRITFPNGEYGDICNDRIIKESLKFDESISSRENIKFGLCESSQLSFECVETEDIKGLEIEAYIEIDTTGTSIPSQTSSDVPFAFYRLPLGRFTVDESKLNAKMNIRKVTAYSVFDFSVPVYMQEKTTFSEINLNVINYLYMARKTRFLDESNFTYTRIPLSFSQVPIKYEYTPDWIWNDSGTLHDKRLCVTVYYNYASFDADNAPNMRKLIRCNNSGLADYAIGDIEANAENIIHYIISAGYTDPEHTIGDAKEVLTECYTLLRNLIRPMPYVYGLPKDYLIGINVGDIYPPSSQIIFVTEVTFALKTKLNSEQYWQTEKTYTYTNYNSSDNASYDVVDTSFYPQYFVNLKGTETDVTNYYKYASAFLNLDNRNLLESLVELAGCFGRINRYGYFELIELAEVMLDGLFPADDLYPSNDLYPIDYALAVVNSDEQEIINNNVAIDLWYEKRIVGFNKIICEYMSSEVLDEDNNPVQVIYEESWDSSNDVDDNFATYDLSDNLIISNNTWTEQGIQTIIESLVESLQKIMFYPAEVSMVGLPYIEAGDEMLVYCHRNRLLVLNLSRTLSGIQALRDKTKTD